MGGLEIADYVALALYFILVAVIGVRSVRYVKSLADFVMPRRFGKLFMLMHSFGTNTHSDQAVSVASKTYSTGLSGIWYQFMWLFATPFYWLIAPMMRRFRALTTADVFEARFSRSVAMLFVVVGIGKFMFTIAVMLKGSGKIIDAGSGGMLNETWVIIFMTILVVAYGMAGGLGAAIVTDFIQGVLTILFSFLLLPFALNAVGGMAGLRETLEPGMLSLVAPGEITVFFIFMIGLNGLLGVAVQPHNMGTCGAGKTEIEGAVGFMGGNFVKRFCTVAWCLTALAAVAHYGNGIEDADKVYGMMAREFLPQIMPGLLGVFIAALFATVMGSCDSFMISASGLVSRNLYRPLFPGKSDHHYLWVARIAALAVVAGGIVLALRGDSVVKMLEQMWKIDGMMAMAFWLGIFWRRTTGAGAWAATLAAIAVWILTGQAAIADWLGRSEFLEAINYIKRDDAGQAYVWLPWQMLSYITAGFLAGIVVSLFSKPLPAEQLERFYELIRTPVQPGEVIAEPCRLPAETPPGKRCVFFPDSNFEIPKPTWRALSGFLVGWFLVILIIGGVWVWIAD